MITITVPARVLRPYGIGTAAGDDVRTGDIVRTDDGAPAIFVGLTPAGCVWITRDGRRVALQRAALARLWERASRRTLPGVRVEVQP